MPLSSSLSSPGSSTGAVSPSSLRSPSSFVDSFTPERRRSSLLHLHIQGRDIPIVASFDRPAPPVPSAARYTDIDAQQLTDALHEQAPFLVPAFARRFAQDVYFELLRRHSFDKRAYLGLNLEQVRFEAPASFCLHRFAGERAFDGSYFDEPFTRGTRGFAPSEQLDGEVVPFGASNAREYDSPLQTAVEYALKKVDTFSWAASVAAFAIGTPLVPTLTSKHMMPRWVGAALEGSDLTTDDLFDEAASQVHDYFAHWTLDQAAQHLKKAMAADEQERAHNPQHGSATVVTTLQAFGHPWPYLYDTLGPLFERVIDCFEFQPSMRPLLQDLMVTSPPLVPPSSLLP